MNITVSRRIRRDIDDVWAAVADTETLAHWQPTLKSVEPVSGRRDERGGTSELVYDENGREVRLTETVREASRPDRFEAEYRGEQAVSVIRNEFRRAGAEETVWTVDCNLKFRGLLAKLIAPFLKTSISRRIAGDMERLQARLDAGEDRNP